jgi:hypothetical protein
VALAIKHHGCFKTAGRIVGKRPTYVQKWYTVYQATGGVKDKPRSGRPSEFTPMAREIAQRLLAETQSCTAVTEQLKEKGLIKEKVHRTTTLRNVVKGDGAMACGPETMIPKITSATEKARLEFANYHMAQHTEWAKVMAIDSSMFTVGLKHGRRRRWRPEGKHATAERVAKQAKVHVYGGITAFGRTRLVRVSGTTGLKRQNHTGHKGQKLTGVGAAEFQKVLAEVLVPDAESIFDGMGELANWSLLMDRAPSHAAKKTKQWLTENEVNIIEKWPGNSPDLNPIENVWGWMKKRIYRRDIKTLDELNHAIDEAWEAVPEVMLTRLMAGMGKRLQKVIDNEGKYIGM